ncbi:sugar ABC transporter permease [Amnibacterium kyonggiense]|uniref:Xylose transport system permease protein XylH n=1 Tax=Amnibacterium kyonggiense TaxID=595671 RepID=A0A4R7FS45_9MICO|nr:ABC transporter permease [Amnibacterium kyonggiense]TDS80675.1 D-xylose transport system permease protein [Amnibacterium kyonggiense]
MTTEQKDVDTSLAAKIDTAGGATPPGIATGYEGTAADQFRAYVSRVRSGEMGMLPALGGFVVLCILFQILSPDFLSLPNIANLMTQTAFLGMLAVALVFVILIAEIDLSAGVTAGVGMAVFVQLNNGMGVNWILAFAISLAVGIVIGLFIGYFVAKVGIPSFVVTLGLFLGFQGLQLVILGDGNTYRVTEPAVTAIENSNIPPVVGWILWAIAVLVTLGTAFYDRGRRVRAGVPVRGIGLLFARVAVIAVVSGAVVFLLNLNRGNNPLFPIAGVPIVVPIVVALLWIGTQILDRTRWGIHLYAVGGNPEAARRAGINVAAIRISAFVLCSGLAIVSGLFQASQVGVVGSSFGQTDVLNGVAAAVVGGVSLFGGRGRLVQGLVGALVITAIANGLGLLALPGGINLLVTGGVLVLAATVDALSRKRAGASLARV